MFDVYSQKYVSLFFPEGNCCSRAEGACRSACEQVRLLSPFISSFPLSHYSLRNGRVRKCSSVVQFVCTEFTSILHPEKFYARKTKRKKNPRHGVKFNTGVERNFVFLCYKFRFFPPFFWRPKKWKSTIV